MCGSIRELADGHPEFLQEKGINLDMLVAASAGEKDNGVALKDAKRSKEDAEQRIREIKQMVPNAALDPESSTKPSSIDKFVGFATECTGCTKAMTDGLQAADNKCMESQKA
jgi:bacterioferritin-associated ferredoxin